MPLRPVPDQPEDDQTEYLTVIAIRSAEAVTAKEIADAVERLRGDTDYMAATIRRPCSELTANDHDHLRALGFDFETANRLATVAWTTEP